MRNRSVDSILVVAYKYPPYSAVGGKRWAKLSKYLARQGVNVHVLTVKWPEGSQAALADVSDPRIHVHRVPSLALNRLRVARPKTYGERLKNRIYRQFVAGRRRGQDAAWWGPALLPAAAWIARKHKVDAVVVTGAPFWANHWMARAKRFLPRGVPLVQEFRDPWADLPESSLVAEGGSTRVERLERQVLASADAIVTVTHGLSELIRAKSGVVPVHTITNGFDPEDLPAVTASGPRPFRLIHGGNLYVGREEPLRLLLEAVARLAHSLPGLELVFRGGFPPAIRADFGSLEESGVLRILPPVPGREFVGEVAEAFAALQFTSSHFPYALSTKIFEYASTGRPTISLNYGGEIERLIRDRDIGWSVDVRVRGAVDEALLETYRRWQADASWGVSPDAVADFSYDQLAGSYRDLLKQLASRDS